MTSIAILGAGTGLGAATARRFGRAGFGVALVSRTRANVDRLAEGLAAEGITARGFAADVRDPDSLAAALAAAGAALGPIEVLQFSPIPHRDFLRPVADTSGEQLADALRFSLFGVFTAVQSVLGGMRDLGRGTVVLVNGGSAVRPRAAVAGTSVGFAAESAYAQILHDSLRAENIYVGQLIVPGAIRADDPESNPAAIADRIWALHTDRGPFRHFLTPMPEG